MPDNTAKVTSLTLQSPTQRNRRGIQELVAVPLLPSFIVGPENYLLRELIATESIAELTVRSPILLFGNSGTGKTAIALTLMCRWLNQDSERRFQCISAADFARAFHRALEEDDMPRFRNQFRSCHGLLLDSIHDIRGKDAIQSELVELLNSSETSQQLIICTSQQLPSFVTGWNDALVSRLLGGYSLEMHPPSPPVRLELLSKIAAAEGLVTGTHEISHLNAQLADNCTALQLKGIVTRWRHQQRIEESLNQSISPGAIDKLVVSQQKPAPSPADIAKNVARELQQTLEAMRGPSRKAGVVRARGLAMHLIRQWTESSYQNIGELFGGRDHTTVMHACKKTEEDLSRDPELSQCVERLRQKLL
ncbi:MAG: DnaA ATPase domain-containing protein [Pirellula sp.]|jgi:chromosomal replication initiator protein